MSHFLLVHGAWHGGWCWEQVVPFLEAAGHQATAPDLPGHGSNACPIADVTLNSYVESLCDLLDGLDQTVVLVGHSMGGIVISELAERRPDSVAQLVYLSAFLIGKGETLLETNQDDHDSLLSKYRQIAEDKLSMTVHPEGIRSLFYHDCSDEDAAAAQARLVPQALAPITTPISVTETNWGRIPRAYIECLQDRALTLDLQRHMQDAHPCGETISLDCGHFPHYAQPELLADALISQARSGA